MTTVDVRFEPLNQVNEPVQATLEDGTVTVTVTAVPDPALVGETLVVAPEIPAEVR